MENGHAITTTIDEDWRLMKTNCDITEACPSSSSCSWQRNARLSHWIWSGALSMWLSYNCFLCGPRGWALWMYLCAGLTYYYNSETKVSVWTKPGEEMASEVEEVDENEVQKAMPWLVLRWKRSSCVYHSQIQSIYSQRVLPVGFAGLFEIFFHDDWLFWLNFGCFEFPPSDHTSTSVGRQVPVEVQEPAAEKALTPTKVSRAASSKSLRGLLSWPM